MQATMFPEPAMPRVSTDRAPRVLLGAIVLGVSTQALFFRAGLGLDWLVWDLMMIGVTLAVLGRGPLKAPALWASALAALLGAAFVAHRSTFTTVVTLPTNLAVLAVLPILVAEDVSVVELGALPSRILGAAARTPWAIFATVLLPRDAVVVLDGAERSVARRTAAGVLLGLPISGVFTLLLCGDAGFAATIGRLETRLDSAVSFGVQAGLTAVIFAFAYGLFGNRTEHPLSPERASTEDPNAPYRTLERGRAVARVSSLTWGIVLAQLVAVFGVYAFVHRDTEFGGHEVVRARGALTYASNLHSGFYQLLLATLLSVGLVVLGHKLLSAWGDDAVPGGKALMALEGALLTLTGVALYSCAHRLKLYEEAYGATLLRLGVAFVVLTAFVLLACTLVKSLWRSFRLLGALTLAGLSAVALCAAWFDADAYVARKNLQRQTVDLAYLSSLSADACAAADLAKPEIRADLVSAWSKSRSRGDVRSFRGLTRCPSVTGP